MKILFNACMCFIGGLLSFALSCNLIYNTIHMKLHSIETTGTIIKIKMYGRRQTPIVQFYTEDHKPHIIPSINIVKGPTSYRVGDNVSVLYLKYLPESARINNFDNNWDIGLFTGVLGIFFLYGSYKIFRGDARWSS